ncbi:cell wall synthesis KRE9KNH1 [Metschnikowia bicuspidata var. bicuspidata NRRL YB-4993]|uniref:Cell wall synthesis KRE9KNH1 n=1 Tax=Metschnikowia bicuspidata var. bicuspidata NRRL YB-4993 TaxID=869754 RepID=A0A1A0HII8_9ASCO|nr:cell wall synthesis KRE9KNH1 [Metschnikowia bicuspidata var. bicuspidata NRRL YB-4993]OBA23816.1 cell wall synthesis KRE9KNH1 [Metschnikowia bicuspidata var. bicuspidata NRRL YB-4993]
MHFLSLWIILVSLAARVLGDVSITSPSTDQTYSGSSGSASVSVVWTDDSDDDADASLSNVDLYAIVLCTGSNSDIQSVMTLTDSLSSSALEYDAVIDEADVPSGVYFIQVYAKFGSGYTIHYSNRFTLTGMSGSTSTYTFSASLFSITGTHPGAQLNLDGETTLIDSRSFSVTYTLQTGKTRYAPMQTQPGSSISHSVYSTRHATSAYTPYSTIRASPNVYSTVTPGWSYAVTSTFNTAAVAEYPTYYYPASSRVVSASLSSANKKRWL